MGSSNPAEIVVALDRREYNFQEEYSKGVVECDKYHLGARAYLTDRQIF